jgi:sugar phosphate isomerase/epimerase
VPAVVLGLEAAGAKLIEIGAWHNDFDYSNRDGVKRARFLLDQAGVAAYSYHPPFGPGHCISHLDEGALWKAVERNADQLGVAAALGAEHYVLHPSVDIRPADRLLHRRNAIRAVRALLPVCESTGMKLAVENMPPGFVAVDAEELMWVVDGAESDLVGVCFDTGHAHAAGYRMGEYLRRIGDRLMTIHWHDNDGTADQHVPPGAGTVDWDDFFGALADMGWDRPICPEIPIPPDWTFRQWVERLRAALAKPGALVAPTEGGLVPRR